MIPENDLQRLRECLMPEQGQKDRVRAQIQARIGRSPVLDQLKNSLTPGREQQHTVWGRVLQGIDVPEVSSLLDRVKALFDPSETQQILGRVALMNRLAPVDVRSSYVWTKRVAAFVLVLVALRASPVLFLAPRTIAESAVIVTPTKGQTEISLHGLWQPVTGEITLENAVQLRTGDGESTVLLHDDGTIRLASHSTIALHDLSDRPEPALEGSTLTLTEGRIWVQGLLPRTVRGIAVATPHGTVTVHDGSVSIAIDDNAMLVRTWDRHAVITQGEVETVLVAGEKARFGEGTAGQPASIADAEYDDPWVQQNLQRDAVHQREIAQLQQERRAAQAGILPTSPLYPVKRVVEQVDMLFTFDAEAKVQKQLELASTRLNEAAALIARGSTGAEVPLQEYKQTLLAVATGSGGGSVTQFLVRQTVAENTAELSAALPDDESYVLKKAVLETSTELPETGVSQKEVQGQILVDTLDVLHDAIVEGNTVLAQQTYTMLEPYLTSLDAQNDLPPGLRKEVLRLLENAAEHLQQSETGTSLATDLKPFLPRKEEPAPVPLTDAEIAAMVEGMMSRIYVYGHPRSQWNQLQYEIVQIKDHPDVIRILRSLYQSLPPELASYVRTALRELR